MTTDEKIDALAILIVEVASNVVNISGLSAYQEIVDKAREIIGIKESEQ